MLQRLVDLLRDLTQTPPPCDAGKCKSSTRKLGEAVPTSPAQTIYIISIIVIINKRLRTQIWSHEFSCFPKKDVFHSLTNPPFFGGKNVGFWWKPGTFRKFSLRIAPRHHDVQHGIIPLLREIFHPPISTKNREFNQPVKHPDLYP